MSILPAVIMLSYLSMPTGTVMGHAQFRNMEDCEKAVVNMKRQQADAVGACVLGTVQVSTVRYTAK